MYDGRVGITVRRMDFTYPADLDPVFIEGEPEESFANIGLSMLLPYLEPYLVRAMKEARSRVTDPALARGLSGFVLQEGQHFRQHRRFNDLFRARFDGFAAFEARAAADFERWSEEKPLAWRLAWAEGFEALTTATACWTIRRGMDHWHPAVRALFEWHLVEELEHRTVAFDVYAQVVGDWALRVRVGWGAQRYLLKFMERFALAMLEGLPDVVPRYGGRRGHRRRMRVLRNRMLFEFLPMMLRSHLPWYTPHALSVPPELDALSAAYSARATHTRSVEE